MERGVEFPVIVFLDGHRSHISPKIAELAESLGIILIGLYPNSTHIIQPLDTCVFKGTKDGWVDFMRAKSGKNLHFSVDNSNFYHLFSEYMKINLRIESVFSGFRYTGIYPWNSDNIDVTKIKSTSRQRKDISSEPPLGFITDTNSIWEQNNEVGNFFL